MGKLTCLQAGARVHWIDCQPAQPHRGPCQHQHQHQHRGPCRRHSQQVSQPQPQPSSPDAPVELGSCGADDVTGRVPRNATHRAAVVRPVPEPGAAQQNLSFFVFTCEDYKFMQAYSVFAEGKKYVHLRSSRLTASRISCCDAERIKSSS